MLLLHTYLDFFSFSFFRIIISVFSGYFILFLSNAFALMRVIKDEHKMCKGNEREKANEKKVYLLAYSLWHFYPVSSSLVSYEIGFTYSSLALSLSLCLGMS